MHLIVVRRDLTGFQHLHPTMSADGTWSTEINLPDAGSYRVFADFNHGGASETLGSDLAVDGRADYRSLPRAEATADAGGGYEVHLAGDDSTAGHESELSFTVTSRGEPVQVEPYLGAGGHLVALREGDMAFLHVHPTSEEAPPQGEPIQFMTEFPSAGSYGLFVQFKIQGRVHTAEFTREASR